MGISGHRVHEIADRVPVPRTHLLLHAGGLGLAAASRVAAAAAGARGFAAAAFTGRRRPVRGLVQHRSVPVALQLAPMQRVLGVRPVGDAASYAKRPLHGLVQHRALPEPLPVGQLQRVLELSSA